MEITNTNLAAGIAFRCKKWSNSKVIIDTTDATTLSGKGEMYLKCNQYDGFRRLQGSYMPPEEIMDMLDEMEFIYSSGYDEVKFEMPTTPEGNPVEIPSSFSSAENDAEQRLVEIVQAIWDEKMEKFSNNKLKLRYHIGYDIANRFLIPLENLGIIGSKEAKKSRIVNLDKANEFLRSHGHLDVLAEKDSIDELNMSLATEAEPELGKANAAEIECEQHQEEAGNTNSISQAQILGALKHASLKSPKGSKNSKLAH